MAASEEQFHSPTLGQINQGVLVNRVREFVAAEQERNYRLIIGTDSLPNLDGQVYLVTAIVLHRVGNGGIYFWQRHLTKKMHSLRDRMYAEALASISMAQHLEHLPTLAPMLRDNIEIHVDVGEFGPTREMIQELVGMIVAHGYSAKTKPESFAASKVADRHTIPGPKLAFVPVTS
ncbi:MAG: ribonuclease H-like YkuK family protein [Candidatus Kerfeldbacteria bacterium]|nr:ribonuclease H-like YkuK family protein [Candidatus Kerfeldbacteria bacterium]